jgi:alanyl-tRNA synthetase
MEALKSAEKDRRRVEQELGVLQGRALYDVASPDARGMRRVVKRIAAGALDPLRAMAQGFCARPKAMFVGAAGEPPQLLLVTSPDSGMDAGKLLKAALAEAGGRGGGAAHLAQGSAPSGEALEKAIATLTALSASPPD